jgi:hypothetical protein
MDVYYRKRLKPGVAHLVVGYIIDHYIQRKNKGVVHHISDYVVDHYWRRFK